MKVPIFLMQQQIHFNKSRLNEFGERVTRTEDIVICAVMFIMAFVAWLLFFGWVKDFGFNFGSIIIAIFALFVTATAIFLI